MSDLVVAPLLVGLVTAILTLGTRGWPRVQRAVAVGGTVAYAATVGMLVSRVLAAPGGGWQTVVYQVGGWEAPYGISLVADPLSAFMLVVAAVVALPAVVAAVAGVDPVGQRVSFHPLFQFMLVGVTGAVLTGDLFNLFVWFEVMLLPSYVLVVFYGGADETAAALKYTALNLVGSALMLVAVGGIYAVTGTLNMAQLSRTLATGDPSSNAAVLGLAGLLLAVFALKAGAVPFQFWVPEAYRAAPAPATAMLAGVTKKVGVYAVVRLLFTILPAATIPTAGLGPLAGDSYLVVLGAAVVAAAGASILVGGLGAVTRVDLDGVFAYSSIGHVGFILLPVGVAAVAGRPALTVLAVAAALVYSLHHALAKTVLFLLAGTVRESIGSDRFEHLGGLASAQPLIAVAFIVAGLSLVGVPPLVGFFGKLMVFDALTGGPGWLPVATLAVALAGAVLTIAYVTRAWSRGFWGEPTDLVANANPPTLQVAIVCSLAAAIVILGVVADPLLSFAAAGGEAALDRSAYVTAVLGGGA